MTLNFYLEIFLLLEKDTMIHKEWIIIVLTILKEWQNMIIVHEKKL